LHITWHCAISFEPRPSEETVKTQGLEASRQKANALVDFEETKSALLLGLKSSLVIPFLEFLKHCTEDRVILRQTSFLQTLKTFLAIKDVILCLLAVLIEMFIKVSKFLLYEFLPLSLFKDLRGLDPPISFC
jgi:hypothetical protein